MSGVKRLHAIGVMHVPFTSTMRIDFIADERRIYSLILDVKDVRELARTIYNALHLLDREERGAT